jgi:head decoration protein D
VANITIENVDLGSVVLGLQGSADGTLQNADADDPTTFAAGTILARHTSDGKYYPFDPAGSNGLNAAKAVLTYELTVAANSGAPVTVLTAGKVNASRLVIHGGTTITAAHLDQLRDYAITPVTVSQLAAIDNPQS